MPQPATSVRDSIAAGLDELVDDAIVAFRRMANVAVPMETKGVAAYMRATNALLDHIDGLVRLKEWIDSRIQAGRSSSDPRDASAPEDPSVLVAAARQALAGGDTEGA